VNQTSFLVVLLLVGSCATSAADRLCKSQGLRFVKESHAVGGIGLVPQSDPKSTRETGTHASGGPRPLDMMPTEGTIGLGNLGVIGRKPVPPTPARAPPPPPPAAGDELVLLDVGLTHAALGRGGQADGEVMFAAPAGSRLVLEANADVPGYGWQLEVTNAAASRVGFWVGCLAGRSRQVVNWSFTLRDRKGKHSGPVIRSVQCTGEDLPGAAPRLEAVTLEDSDLVAGWKTSGTARFSGTHPPLQLIARSDSPDYGWRASPRTSSPVQQDFHVECRQERQVHGVRWRFSVRDTFGRESNVIEKLVSCGVCRQ